MASKGSEKPELIDMLKYISDVDWNQLGLHLKLPQGKLNDISADKRNAANQRSAMLGLWLRHCPDASWNIFADALDRMEERDSATRVRQDHRCGGLAPVPSSSSAPVRDDSDDVDPKDVEQPAEGVSEEKVDGGAGIVKRMKNVAFRKGPVDCTDGENESKVERFYKMDSREKFGQHGTALIINNIKWSEDDSGKPYMQDRNGAIAGATALQKALQAIGYNVKVEKNLETGKEIKDKLKQVLEEQVLPADDSFICFISTHGDEDGVYGTKGRPRSRKLKPDGSLVEDERAAEHKPVSIENLCEVLEPDVCEKLRSKPKIFFIQACRGEKLSEPIDHGKGDPPVRQVFVPRHADFYSSYATDSGNVALRKGYPEYLSQNLREKLSLDEIVMKVHKSLASSQVASVAGSKHLQIGQVVHTMQGPVYF